MSGGHFSYGCYRISQFADELQHEININNDKTIDSWGSTVGSGFNEETMARVKKAHQIIEKAGGIGQRS